MRHSISPEIKSASLKEEQDSKPLKPQRCSLSD